MPEHNAPSEDAESALKRRKLELEVAAAERENELRARKLAAEAHVAENEIKERQRKLMADVVVSERQASKQWLILEWLKAATVPVALVGLLATSVLSIFQLDVARKQATTAERQADYAREQFSEQVKTSSRQAQIQDRERRLERLDKALEKLSAVLVPQRVAAITSIRLLLTGESRDIDRPALISLIDRLSLEEDQVVQSVMLSAFDPKVLAHLETSALDAALATAAERSRLLRKQAEETFVQFPRWENLDEALAKKSGDVGDLVKLVAEAAPIPSYHREDLEFPRIRYNPADILNRRINDVLSHQLSALSRVIEFLFAAGARHQDLSGIYCPACVFAGKDGDRAASVTSFQGAILDRATFRNIDLSRSSFDHARILGATFDRVNLAGATLSLSYETAISGILEMTESRRRVSFLPVSFSCSDLTNAKVNRVPLVALSIQIARDGIEVSAAVANLRSTRMNDNWTDPQVIGFMWIDSRPTMFELGEYSEDGLKDIFELLKIDKPVEALISDSLKYRPGEIYARMHPRPGARADFEMVMTETTTIPYLLKKWPQGLRTILEDILKEARVAVDGKSNRVRRETDIPADLDACHVSRDVVASNKSYYQRVPWKVDESSVWKKFRSPKQQ